MLEALSTVRVRFKDTLNSAKKSFSTLQKSAQGTENQSLLPLFFQATIHDQEALALLVVLDNYRVGCSVLHGKLTNDDCSPIRASVSTTLSLPALSYRRSIGHQVKPGDEAGSLIFQLAGVFLRSNVER